jgi:hypothetical protein
MALLSFNPVVAALSGGEQVVVPFPAPREQIPLPTAIRSTLIASSIRSIRERGLLDAYREALDPQWKSTILDSIAGEWLDLGAGIAHYRACDALVFSALEQVAIGREVGDRIQGTFIGTMVRTAKNVGVDPWNAFPFTPKLYDRLFDGGGCCVMRVGPKDATLELARNPLVRVAYFRNGMRGLWQGAVELFCRKAYLAEVERTDLSYKVKISWA